MAKKYRTDSIPSGNYAEDWGGSKSNTTPAAVDETNDMPYSGEAVQKFIKDSLQRCETKIGCYCWSSSPDASNFYHLWGFANEDDKIAYMADPEGCANLLLVNEALPISTVQGDSYGAYLWADVKSSNEYIVSGSEFKVKLRFAAVRTNNGDRLNMGAAGTLIVQRKTNSSEWTTVDTRKDILSSTNYADTSNYTEIDLGSCLISGKQQLRVRASVSYTDDNGETKTATTTYVTIGSSITRTTLDIVCQQNWQTPIYADTYMERGYPISYMVYGAVAKTLHVDITGGSGQTLSLSYALTADQDSATITKNITDSTDAYKLWKHGVRTVKAWLTCDDGQGGTISSQTLVNRFMVVNPTTEADKTTPYLMIQNLLETCDNYAQADLCQYAVFSPGADGSTNNGEDVTTIFYLTAYAESFPEDDPTQYFRIEQVVSPGTMNTLNTTVEIEAEDTEQDILPAYFRVWRKDGNGDEVNFLLTSQGIANAIINVDNSESFAPKSGADFVLNPKTRNNSESNPLSIINAKTGKEIESTWTGFGLVKDGWIASDEDGQRVLRVPAGAKVNFKYNPFAQFIKTADSSLEIEIDFKTRNVTNEDDPIISLFEEQSITDTDGTQTTTFRGLKMQPMGGEIHTKSNAVSDETNFKWREGQRTHIAVNIHNAVAPNKGDALIPTASTYDVTATKIALVRVFINGDIEREFKYSITDTEEFCTGEMSNGGFTIGQEGADIDIYGIRIYQNTALEATEVQDDYISTLPTTAEKQALRTANDIMTSGKIDMEKCREHGYRCLIYHGKEPYKESTSVQKCWWEIYQYDVNGNYLPEYSGTLCKATCSLETKRQGSTANTYYYSNIQIKMGDVEDTINVLLADLHESIKYEVKDVENEDGTTSKVVSLKGGCLGKNFPTDEKAKDYDYIEIDGQPGVVVPDGWIDGNGKYRGMGYQVAAGVPMAQKLVNKINYASSMMSHLPGVNNIYNDLHTKIVGKNSLQEAYGEARVSKYTEPFIFFTQALDSDTPVFRGPCTWGAGKMDKPTWGYVKKLHPMFAMFEGSDNNYDLTDMRVPFTWDEPDCSENITYKGGDDEGFFYNGMQCLDFDAGATQDDAQSTPKQALIDVLQNTWNFLFLHSPHIEYYKGTFDKFQSSDAAKNTFNKYWCTDGTDAYLLKRYNYVDNKWVDAGLWDSDKKTWKTVNIRTDEITGDTYTASVNKSEYKLLNDELKGAIVAHAKKYIGWYFKVKSLQLYYTLIVHMLCGTDNCSKNTYFVIDPKATNVTIDGVTKTVYLMELHTDDVDTMLAIDNNGRTTKPYYIDRMHPYVDGDASTNKYEGAHNILFNLCELMWENTKELQSMAKTIMTTMEGMVTETDVIAGFPSDGQKVSVYGCLWKYIYFIQAYFPQVVFNEAARIRYEFPEMIGFVSYGSGARGVRPITQSNGALLQCELQFIERRLVLMASYAAWGPFADGKSGALGIADATEGFSLQAFHTPDTDSSLNTYAFTVTPHQYLYPTGMLGQTSVDPHVRVAPGEQYTLLLGTTSSNDTGMSVSGINYYRSIGNIGDLSTTPKNTITINGKRLVEFIAEPSKTYADAETGIQTPAFRPGGVNVTAKNLKVFSMRGCSGTSGNVDLSNESRLVSVDVWQTRLTTVTLPDTHTLTAISFPNTITRLDLETQANLSTVKLQGVDNLNVLILGENIPDSKAIFDLCYSGNAPLKTLKLAKIDWEDVNLRVVNYLASIENSTIAGKIAVTNNTSNRPTFSDKICWLYHWGNIDDTKNSLYITYYSSQIVSVSVVGEQYMYETGSHTFTCVPLSQNTNDVASIKWALDENLYATLDTQEKDSCIVNVTQLGDEDTLAPTAMLHCYLTKTNGEVLEASVKLGLYPRRAHLGDYVFYDGTWGDTNQQGKTVVGVCFYVNPADASDRRMVATKNVPSSAWGLYPNADNGIYPLELQDDTNYSVYDIASITNITGNGLVNAEGKQTYYITADSYLDENTADGFVHTDVINNAENDGIASPNTTITGKDTLTKELAIYCKDRKAGDEVPVGLIKTLKIIQHCYKILEDSGVGLPVPETNGDVSESAMLEQYLSNIVSENDNMSKYQQYYYPAASRCHAYQPSIKSGEELKDIFKAHNWYLPSIGELQRLYWHAKQGVNYDDDKIGAIFTKAISEGVFADFGSSWYWSSSEYSSSAAWYVTFSNGGFSYWNYKYGSGGVRAVAAF